MGTEVEAQVRQAISEHHRMVDRTFGPPGSPGIEAIARAVDALVKVLGSGGRVYLCGNGGSAADAQHIAGELVGRFGFDRRPLPAVALTTDTSVMTAVGNDLGFERAFSRQVEALVGAGDMLWVLSTSGSSPSVLEAAKAARARGALVLGFTGPAGSPIEHISDICLVSGPGSTARIQEIHQIAYHIICGLVESRLCSAD